MSGDAVCVVVSADMQEEALLPTGLITTGHGGSTVDGRGREWLDAVGMDALRGELVAALDQLEASDQRAAVERALELVDHACSTGTGIAVAAHS
ncbi:MAG: hypothetical protein V7636_2489 [Actinomycetota bacterium]